MDQFCTRYRKTIQKFEQIKVPVTFQFSMLQILITLFFYIGVPVLWVIIRSCVWTDYSNIYNELAVLDPNSPLKNELLEKITTPYTISLIVDIFSPIIAMFFLIFTTKQYFYKSGIFFLFIWTPGVQLISLVFSFFTGSVIGLTSLLIDFIFKGVIVIWMIFFFKSLRKMFKTVIEHWVISLIMIVLIAGFSYLLSWSIGLISSDLLNVDNSANQKYLEEMFKDKGLGMISVILSTLLVAPLIEEFIFRGLLGDFTKNTWYSVILTALYFAFAHISAAGDWAAIFFYLGSSLCFSVCYKLTNNIYYSCVGHFILNLISIIVLLVATL